MEKQVLDYARKGKKVIKVIKGMEKEGMGATCVTMKDTRLQREKRRS